MTEIHPTELCTCGHTFRLHPHGYCDGETYNYHECKCTWFELRAKVAIIPPETGVESLLVAFLTQKFVIVSSQWFRSRGLTPEQVEEAAGCVAKLQGHTDEWILERVGDP